MFSSFTPFPSEAWDSVDCDNKWFKTSLVRVRYNFDSIKENGQWNLKLHKEQGELFGEDEYLEYIEQENNSIRFESDYVAFKKNSDLILNSFAYDPIENMRSYNCGVEAICEDKKIIDNFLTINNRNNKDKQIQKALICYENSYGGTLKKINEDGEEKIVASDPINPIGCGIKSIKANENINRKPFISFSKGTQTDFPPGFGALSRSFKSRLKHAGTYDKKWLEEKHPLPPYDFDFKYNQASNPKMIIDGYIKENTKIYLHNLLPKQYLKESEKNIQSFTIPTLNLYTTISSAFSSDTKKLNIDTVLVDILDEDIKKCCLYVYYRDYSPLPKAFKSVQTHFLNDDNISGQMS